MKKKVDVLFFSDVCDTMSMMITRCRCLCAVLLADDDDDDALKS